jgi:hypothetical protein
MNAQDHLLLRASSLLIVRVWHAKLEELAQLVDSASQIKKQEVSLASRDLGFAHDLTP